MSSIGVDFDDPNLLIVDQSDGRLVQAVAVFAATEDRDTSATHMELVTIGDHLMGSDHMRQFVHLQEAGQRFLREVVGRTSLGVGQETSSS